jgi:hypothetical protein
LGTDAEQNRGVAGRGGQPFSRRIGERNRKRQVKEMDTLGVTAIIALVLNLLSVIHYGTRLRRDIVDQVKADERRWGDHETRLELLKQALQNSQSNLSATITAVDARLDQMDDILLHTLAELIEPGNVKSSCQEREN